jgi:CzcA family heavy metal efflux pump
MLNWILSSALRHRTAVLIGALAVAVFGTASALRRPIDVLPSLDRPLVTVLTEAHGRVAVDVEQWVTRPIEQVLSGAAGVHRVRSTSGPGLSVINVEFEWGLPLPRARQVVAEKLQLALPQLPAGAQPTLAPESSILGQVQIVGFRSPGGALDADALRRLVDGEVRPRLLTVPGVAQVLVSGGQPTQLQVEVDAQALRAFQVTLAEVAEAVRTANVAASGGAIQIGSRGPLVNVDGQLRGPQGLATAVVRAGAGGARPVLLGDVAQVGLGPSTTAVGDAGIDGGPGVVLVVSKQPGVDTTALTARLEAELAALRPSLPADLEILPQLFRQADFIERAVHNVLDAVRDGGLLVVLVLVLFLWNLRTTLITLTAIPLSLAATALVFDWLGLSIDTMTLGGLAVAIGTLVDDAIVDVENVYRRLHENARSAAPLPLLEVVFRGASEVRRPVLYGTLIVTVVYVPLFFLSGLEGRLFAPIGLAYVISVAASMVVALTVTPVLCSLLLRRGVRGGERYGTPLVGWLRAAAERGTRFGLEHPTGLWASGAVALLAVPPLLATRGWSFLPPFDEGAAQVNLILPPDTDLATTAAFGSRLERAVLEVEGVRSVARRTGRASGDDHAMPVHVNEAIVALDPDSGRGREELVEDLRAVLAREFPGVASETEQPLAHLLSHLLSGVTAQVAVVISGPDLDALRTVGAEVEAALEPIAGVRDLFVEPQVQVEQLAVRPDRAALAHFGLTVAQVAETVELATGGEEVSRYLDGPLAREVVVRLAARDRARPEQLGQLTLRTPGAETVRLDQVAEVRLERTPNQVKREGQQRRLVVQHNVAGRALSEVVAEVEAALEEVRADLGRFPGTTLRVSGQFEAQRAATRRITALGALAALVMGGILATHFRSLRLALLVLATRPLGLLGGALAVWFSGQDLSVATLVGFLALLGMATRNAILLVDHSLELGRAAGGAVDQALLVRAARERVAPVVMTALTSGIGLLPLALAGDQPGRELLHPVATVVIGGLCTSTLLDFLFTPSALWHLARRELDRLTRDP